MGDHIIAVLLTIKVLGQFAHIFFAEEVAKDMEILNESISNVKLELKLAAGEAGFPFHFAFWGGTVIPIPARIAFFFDFVDNGPLFVTENILSSFALGNQVPPKHFLKFFYGNGGRQIGKNVSHPTAYRLHTFRLKFVGLNVKGFLNHRKIGVKQDGSVVKQAALGSVLGIARKLLAINGYVVAARKLSLYS
jgi:hypothetical protein